MLTDQPEWAVCGRSAGVMNMDTAKKQTVVVEVMALVGGHLLLPKGLGEKVAASWKR